jgi:hypothetical protein
MSSGKRSIKPSEKKLIDKKAAKEPAEALAETPHVTEFEDLVDILPDLAIEARAINAEITRLEKRKKEIAGEISGLLEAVEQRSIRGDNWVAVRVEGAWQEKIVAELLLKEGVSLKQIAAATSRQQNAGYVQVREIKS